MTDDSIKGLREEIREIWRPLLDRSVHAQEMAYLITAATDETETLIQKAVTEARIEELEKLLRAYYKNGESYFKLHLGDYIKTLKKEK